MKKWECTICGYIHEGDEPPDECPVCGAGPEYFKEIEEKGDGSLTEAAVQSQQENDQAETSAGDRKKTSDLANLIYAFHLHPISVHIPNGVMPVALLFLLVSMLFGAAGFELASFYNMAFVLVSMPAVIFTGVMVWRNHYKGAKTKIFITKIIASCVVLAALTAMIVWRLVDPGVASSANRWVYFLLGAVVVGAVGLAGYMGGKLVFGARRS